MCSLHLALTILVVLLDLLLEIWLGFVLIERKMAVIFRLGLMRNGVRLWTSLGRIGLLERRLKIGCHSLVLILWGLTMMHAFGLRVPLATFHVTLLIKYHLIPHHELGLQIFLVQLFVGSIIE